MKKLPFTKKYLLKKYKKNINQLLDDCDWIDYIENWRMCGVISVICRNKGLIIDDEKLLKLYENKVKSLNVSNDEWREQYANWETGVPKIITLIYEILENKFQ